MTETEREEEKGETWWESELGRIYKGKLLLIYDR